MCRSVPVSKSCRSRKWREDPATSIVERSASASAPLILPRPRSLPAGSGARRGGSSPPPRRCRRRSAPAAAPGARRSRPAATASRPSAVNASCSSVFGTSALRPRIRPMPRTSETTCGYSARPRPPAWRAAARPCAAPPSRKPGASITSSTALAAAQASGLPPNVVPCVPGTRCLATCSLARIAPIGKPPAMPLAADITSGSMPAHSWANSLPVRPMPDCTSSMPSRMPNSSQAARSPRRNSALPDADAAFALHRLDQHARRLRPDRVAQRVQVVERHVVEALHLRAEPGEVFLVPRGRQHGERAAVERALEADDAVALGLCRSRSSPCASS